MISGFPFRHYLGTDIARRRHLTVLWLDEEVDGILWTREVVCMKNAPFENQYEERRRMFRQYKIIRCCLDQGGMGEPTVEAAKKEHGSSFVEGVLFTPAVKQILAGTGKQFYEDRRLRTPQDIAIRDAHHIVKRTQTAAGNFRFDAESSERDLPFVTQEHMRKMARYLWENNLLGNRLIELPPACLLAEGVSFKSEKKKIQKILKKFWNDPINNMNGSLKGFVRECHLYGELCLPAFVNQATGRVRLGYLNPDRIKHVIPDPDNARVIIGIETVTDIKGGKKRYRTILNGKEENLFTKNTCELRETFSDGECFYFRINGLTDGQHGRSDLLSSADWLDGYEHFMFGELDRTDFLRAWTWDVTLNGANDAKVNEYAKKIQKPKPGSVRVHNENVKRAALSPKLESADNAETARVFRNHLPGGGTIPEFWFGGGGGGDVNRNTATEMGDPTYKILSMRQEEWKSFLKETAIFAVKKRCIAKNTKIKNLSGKISVNFPELASKDISRYAAALQQIVVAVLMMIDKNILTEETGLLIIQTISNRLGVEFDAKKELKAAATAAANRDAFPPDSLDIEEPSEWTAKKPPEQLQQP